MVESALHALELVGLFAVLFRVVLVLFFVIAFRWCAMSISKLLSVESSMAFGSLGAVGADDSHERSYDTQWTFLAGR